MELEYTEKYLNILYDEMSSVLEKDIKRKDTKRDLKQVIFNTIFDKKGPRVISTTIPDKSLFIGNKLFRGFSEIYTTVESLRNIEKYVRRFPYRDMRISRLDYLKYHIESYLNEVYILKERMVTYNKVIARAYRKSENAEQVKKELAQSSKLVSDSLKNIVEVRGTHVHEHRYTDPDLDRLSTLELLSNSDMQEAEIFNSFFIEEYKKIKKKWINTIRVNNSTVEQIINLFSKTLLECITNGTSLIYPTNTVWS